MSTYSVAFDPERSIYEVEVQDDIGGHVVLGFETKAAAQEWIAEDQRIDPPVNET